MKEHKRTYVIAVSEDEYTALLAVSMFLSMQPIEKAKLKPYEDFMARLTKIHERSKGDKK